MPADSTFARQLNIPFSPAHFHSKGPPVHAGPGEACRRPSESLYAVEDNQDPAAQQALQEAHAVHHAHGDHFRGSAGPHDTVSPAQAGLWHQGSGGLAGMQVMYCFNVQQDLSLVSHLL